MDNQKSKLIIIWAVIIIILAIIVTIVIVNKNNKPVEINQTISLPQKKVIKESATKSVIGKVNVIDVNTMEVTTDKGEKLMLNIPSKEVSFIKQSQEKEGEILLEDIGLLDISKEQNVEVQYNSQTDDLMMVTVK